GGVLPSPLLPQLVSPGLSLCLRRIPVCGELMASRKIAQAFLSDPKEQFARDVTRGLTRAGQKELSSTYLYDDVGSALFEAITHLAEYGLTRADERVLETHADAIVS